MVYGSVDAYLDETAGYIFRAKQIGSQKNVIVVLVVSLVML
jgi:hypothetical protein